MQREKIQRTKSTFIQAHMNRTKPRARAQQNKMAKKEKNKKKVKVHLNIIVRRTFHKPSISFAKKKSKQDNSGTNTPLKYSKPTTTRNNKIFLLSESNTKRFIRIRRRF